MIQNRHDLNRAVLAVMEQTPDARRREIMMSLVTHLHLRIVLAAGGHTNQK